MKTDKFVSKLFACAIVLLFLTGAWFVTQPVSAKTSSRADIVITDNHVVSGTETYDTVTIKTDGILTVPSGTTVVAKQVVMAGGSFMDTGGKVIIDRSTAGNGIDALFIGSGVSFQLKNGEIDLKGANAGNTFWTSQGGDGKISIKVTDSLTVDNGKIIAKGGDGYMQNTPWLDGAALESWTSAGGSAMINIQTNMTTGTETAVVANATFQVTGGNGASAPSGHNGAPGVKGPGGGYITNAQVGGHVGSGGYANVSIWSTAVEIRDTTFLGQGGNGGNAGNGGNGGVSSDWNNPAGGGGGGGYAGGSGALGTSTGGGAGKGGAVSGYVGGGGSVLFSLYADFMNVTNTQFTGTGGNGGNGGDGGKGAEVPDWTTMYSGAGGGAGFGGGGGGAYYGQGGGQGSITDYVAKGGSVTVKIISEVYLKCENVKVTATGGNGGNGGKGGQGTQNAMYYYYSLGGGAGGMAGGGGGAYSANPGTGATSNQVASGGNITVWFISTGHLEVINCTVIVTGGNGGYGGQGGIGGYGGGGGAGLGGGGGAGYNWNGNKGGKGTVADFVGMGGSVNIALRGIESLVVLGNSVTATGGKGGNSGIKGDAGSTGMSAGGGGIAGGGGAYMGTGGDSSITGRPCDGGDVTMFVESKAPSVATDNKFGLDTLKGGAKGNGLGAQGTGGSTGGSGKGRKTADGQVLIFIPMSIPHPLTPVQDQLLQGPVTFTWSRAFDAWDGAKDRPPVRFGIQIDNTSAFKSPIYENDGIDAGTDNLLVDGLMGGVLYWRVRAVYDIGTTDWSELKMFKHAADPILVKMIPTIKLDENTDATDKLDLNNYFTDALWPTKLNYTVATQEKPDKVLVSITDGHYISVSTVDKKDFWYGSSTAVIKATNKATQPLSNVSNKFTISVTHVNQAPFITQIPDQTVTEDTPTVLDLSKYINDVDNPFSQLTITTDSPYITVSGMNLTIDMEWVKATSGLQHVNYTVSDLQLTSYGSFNVTVNFVNEAPTIKKITDRTMEENSPLSFSLIPYGKDEEDTATSLTWSAVSGLLITANITDNVITLTPKKDQFGNDTITLTVKDTAGASTQTTLKVLVLHVNQAPNIGAIEDKKVMAGTPVQYNLEQYISDVDNLKSELVLTSDSKYVTSIVGFTVTILYPLDTQLDSDTITFTVSDGIDSTMAKMKVAIQRPPRFINTIPEVVVQQGQTAPTIMLDYMATNSNGENNQLVWTVSNKGDKSLTTATIKNKNQLIVSGGTSKTGTTTLRVTCTDNLGLTAYQDVKVTVKEVPGGIGVGATSDNLMIPFILIVVLIAMVGATIGYKMKLNSDRIRRIRTAREARLKRLEAKVQTKEGVSLTGTTGAETPDKLESAQTGPSAQQMAHLSRIAPLCFACGTKTRPDEHGRFVCPKCNRVSR